MEKYIDIVEKSGRCISLLNIGHTYIVQEIKQDCHTTDVGYSYSIKKIELQHADNLCTYRTWKKFYGKIFFLRIFVNDSF